MTKTDVNIKMKKHKMVTIKLVRKMQSPLQRFISSIRRHCFPLGEMFVRIVCKPCPQLEEQSVLPDFIFCSEIQKENKYQYTSPWTSLQMRSLKDVQMVLKHFLISLLVSVFRKSVWNVPSISVAVIDYIQNIVMKYLISSLFYIFSAWRALLKMYRGISLSLIWS